MKVVQKFKEKVKFLEINNFLIPSEETFRTQILYILKNYLFLFTSETIINYLENDLDKYLEKF